MVTDSGTWSYDLIPIEEYFKEGRILPKGSIRIDRRTGLDASNKQVKLTSTEYYVVHQEDFC